MSYVPVDEGERRAKARALSPEASRRLRERRAARAAGTPVWERCAGCGREYAYPHLCREHALCGLCHPALT